MRNKVFSLFILLFLLLVMFGCEGVENPVVPTNNDNGEDDLKFWDGSFANRGWEITTDYNGPSADSNLVYCSESLDNVWVDDQNPRRLHLKITYDNANKRWNCAQIESVKTLGGYGKYTFYIDNVIMEMANGEESTELDKNVVIGLYTYDNGSSDSSKNEIDLEFSKWGDPRLKEGWFIVWEDGGQLKRDRCNFPIQLVGKSSVHSFDWTENSIDFKSASGGNIKTAHYPSIDFNDFGDLEGDGYIPQPQNEKVLMNIWLDGGEPYNDDMKSVEIIISNFEFDRDEQTQVSVSNKVFLQSGGNLNGTSINPSNPTLTVNTGESITGILNVQAIYSGTPGNVVPFGYTPSWGSHSSSYVTVKSDLPVGTSTYNVSIDLNAPTTFGTYYLIFASNCEMNLGWTMSQTNWTTGTMSWNDGNDIADLTESKLQSSLSTGYLYLDMLVGSSYKTTTYGITYVKIIITEGGSVGENGTYDLRDTGPAGGYIFYDKGSYSNGWRYLEAAPVSTEWDNKQWGSYGTSIGGTGTGIGTGKSNTTKIATWLNSHSETDRAAQLCDALVYGGYSDWFLPSKEELSLMYKNLKVFGVGGFLGVNEDDYWSSSESGADNAWRQSFEADVSYPAYKYLPISLRAARAF